MSVPAGNAAAEATERPGEQEASDYWQRVREIAASRPPLTEEQQAELAAIIRKSRIRRATERLLASGEDAT